MKFLAYAYRKTCIELISVVLLALLIVPNAFSALRQIDLDEYSFLAATDTLLTSTVIGDVDGDDLDDIALADPNDSTSAENAGVVYVFFADTLLNSESTEIRLAQADKTYHGGAGDFLGTQITAVGDTDDDGLDDFTIGTADQDQAYLILGSMLIDNEENSTGTDVQTREAIVTASIGIGESVDCSLDAGADGISALGLGIMVGQFFLLLFWGRRMVMNHHHERARDRRNRFYR